MATRWFGVAAAKMYSGVVAKALPQHRPDKSVWRVVEDSNHAGFTSVAGVDANKAAGIKAIDWPSYSPEYDVCG